MHTGEKSQNLIKLDLSLSFDEIGGFALPVVFYVTVSFSILFIVFNGFLPIIYDWSLSTFLLWSLPILGVGIILHELIHGVCFALLSGKSLSFVKYGFDKVTLTPYAHCKTPIRAWVYKIGALMPAIILGIMPFVASVVTANVYLFFFGTFFTTAACGDFIIFWMIKNVDNKALVEDHPKKAGCFIYIEENSNANRSINLSRNALLFHKLYKTPFILLILIIGAIFGYRLFRALNFYFQSL